MTSIRGLVEHAKRSGGVFTLHDAAAFGVSRTMLSTRLEQGLFTRIGRGVFALPGTSTRADLMLRAACRVLGAVVSHESAGMIHGFSPLKVESPTVTVSHRSSHRFAGVTVHQSTDLLEAHTCRVDGLVATTPPRTIIDLSQTLSIPRLDRLLDNALAGGLVDIGELADLLLALSRKGKKGVRRLRRLIEGRTDGPVAHTSELEGLLLDLIRRAGLPAPVREFRAPWLKSIEGRVDFAYPDQRLIVEADSRRWHAMNDAFEVDRRRDNAAQVAGWRVLRFTWRMVADEPLAVVSTLRQALSEPPHLATMTPS
jgi:hypothetical protein